MELILKKRKLLTLAEGERKRPDPTIPDNTASTSLSPQSPLDQWDDANATILHIITKSVDDQIKSQLKGLTSAAEAWSRLTTHFKTRTHSTTSHTTQSPIPSQDNSRTSRKSPLSHKPKSANSTSKSSERPKCLNCRKFGHVVEVCWAEGGGAEGVSPKRKKSKGQGTGERSEGLAWTTRQDWKQSKTHQTYTAHSDEDTLRTRRSSRHIHFIIDSGASSHMTNDASHYSSFHKLETPTPI
ncbi:uncharacterized protein EI90DRAFT_2954707, partial [Cantharellus anzutake]|uniref:uncharacterized protein n=1 Tax=Cantharellus anzutake TaxID=1750568 RepID=UPI0019035622